MDYGKTFHSALVGNMIADKFFKMFVGIKINNWSCVIIMVIWFTYELIGYIPEHFILLLN